MKDSMDNIIYIGKSKNLKTRIKSYFYNSDKSNKINKMIALVYSINYLIKDTDFEARLEECRLIKKYKPIFNSQYKNDSRYMYIYWENEELKITNRRIENSIGPIRNRKVAEEIIKKFHYIEPISYYNKIYSYDYKLFKELDTNIKNKIYPINILKSNLYLEKFILSLEDNMLKNSKKLNFEKAQYFYEFIKILKPIQRINNLYEKLGGKNYIIKINEKNTSKYFYLKNGKIIDKNKKLDKLKIDAINENTIEDKKLIINNKNYDYLNIIYSEVKSSKNTIKEIYI